MWEGCQSGIERKKKTKRMGKDKKKKKPIKNSKPKIIFIKQINRNGKRIGIDSIFWRKRKINREERIKRLNGQQMTVLSLRVWGFVTAVPRVSFCVVILIKFQLVLCFRKLKKKNKKKEIVLPCQSNPLRFYRFPNCDWNYLEIFFLNFLNLKLRLMFKFTQK